MLDKDTRERLMRVVIEEAKAAADSGNEPFAALLCDKDGNIIVIARNSEADEATPISHAETTLIRKACSLLGTRDLSPYSVVANAECCPMCTSALTLSGVRSFYTGARMEEFCNPFIPMKEILSHAIWPVTVVDGILEEECRAVIAASRDKREAADNSIKYNS